MCFTICLVGTTARKFKKSRCTWHSVLVTSIREQPHPDESKGLFIDTMRAVDVSLMMTNQGERKLPLKLRSNRRGEAFRRRYAGHWYICWQRTLLPFYYWSKVCILLPTALQQTEKFSEISKRVWTVGINRLSVYDWREWRRGGQNSSAWTPLAFARLATPYNLS